MIALLRELGEASFARLTEDAADTLTVVARFLALLELYREKAVALDQEEALGAAPGPLDGRRAGRRGHPAGDRRIRPGGRGQARPGPERRAAVTDVADVTEAVVEVPETARQDPPAGRPAAATAELELKPALEAVLMVVDEPATEEHLAKVLERPRRAVAEALRELSDDYTGRGPRLRPAAGRRRLAFLHPARVRARRGELRPGRPARPPHPGRAGDAGGRRVPPAGQPLPGLRGPRGELRRRHAHPAAAGSGRGRWARNPRQVRSCTGRRTTSWSVWACAAWTSSRSSRRSSRRRTRSRPSPRRAFRRSIRTHRTGRIRLTDT